MRKLLVRQTKNNDFTVVKFHEIHLIEKVLSNPKQRLLSNFSQTGLNLKLVFSTFGLARNTGNFKQD